MGSRRRWPAVGVDAENAAGSKGRGKGRQLGVDAVQVGSEDAVGEGGDFAPSRNRVTDGRADRDQ